MDQITDEQIDDHAQKQTEKGLGGPCAQLIDDPGEVADGDITHHGGPLKRVDDGALIHRSCNGKGLGQRHIAECLPSGKTQRPGRFDLPFIHGGQGTLHNLIHMGGAVGVLVNFDTTDEVAATEDFAVMGKDVAMQIAAMSPSYLDPASVPAEVLDHETEILKAQMKEDPKMANKPEQVLANIVKGKLGKYYKENCLLNQEFVKAENHEDVAAYVASVAKKIGGDIKVTGFTRYAKGEGIEKKEENFAAEIASMVK